MMTPTILAGDCLDVIRTLPDCSIDAVVTDPPYALTQNKKGGSGDASINLNSPAGRSRISTGAGFMGKKWDTGEVAFSVEFWAEVLRVLKPGGHVVAFGGTRTYHRMACAIEDAGLEIRDQLQWLYGTGFPKSRNIGDGWGTALKPANEPICLARKPLSEPTVAANVLRWGTGALNIDATRIEGAVPSTVQGQSSRQGEVYGHDQRDQRQFVGSPLGRWPANVLHDGSPEVVAMLPESGGSGPARTLKRGLRVDGDGWGMAAEPGALRDAGSGSAARFFYSAKASKADRANSKHPTVKPVSLMRWLVRLVTPPGGTILDPFAGSGTTGAAALAEGFDCVLIEREAEYLADIRRRFGLRDPVEALLEEFL